MGFFDGRPDTPTGMNFVSREEKKVLAEEGVPLTIISVGIGLGFEGRGKAYYFTTEIEGETRAVGGFTIGSGVDSRDALFADLMEYLETEEGQADTVTVRLEKAGKAWLVVNADAPANA